MAGLPAFKGEPPRRDAFSQAQKLLKACGQDVRGLGKGCRSAGHKILGCAVHEFFAVRAQIGPVRGRKNLHNRLFLQQLKYYKRSPRHS
jgi:hypothetical protein